MREIAICVYRDLSNRLAGEPDDGPMAWAAHRERRRVIADILADPSLKSEKNEAEDETRTHELTETIIQIYNEPTTHIVLTAAALYVGKVVAKQIDDVAGRGVRYVFQKLLDVFKKKKIADYWITLPDNSKVAVQRDAQVVITFKDGKVIEFNVETPPSNENDAI